jgi:hypothetical protein
MLKLISIFFILHSALATICWAETPDKTTLMLFEHFLRQFDELQQPSAALNRVSAATVREHYQSDYDLDDTSFAAIAKEAATYAASVKGLDEQAAAIIKRAKQRHRAQGTARAPSVPPPPPELAALQQQRTDLITQALENLESSLGPAQLRYLLYWVKIRLGRQSDAIDIRK